MPWNDCVYVSLWKSFFVQINYVQRINAIIIMNVYSNYAWWYCYIFIRSVPILLSIGVDMMLFSIRCGVNILIRMSICLSSLVGWLAHWFDRGLDTSWMDNAAFFHVIAICCYTSLSHATISVSASRILSWNLTENPDHFSKIQIFVWDIDSFLKNC